MAQSKDSRIKSWKTLTNDNGFEFKYPDCWEPRVDNPDEGDLGTTSAHDVAVTETSKCARPLLDDPQENHAGIGGGRGKTMTEEEVKKEINFREKNAPNDILRKELLYFKKFKVGSNDAIVYVDFHQMVGYSYIDWIAEIYCPTTKVTYGGPSIKDPDKSYYDKFKAGDLAMPEPEKTIFESVRCIEPKKKPEKKTKK